RTKAVSDAYGLDLVDTTFRVRNGLISWEEGLQVVDNARLRAHEHWRALEQMPLTEEQQALFDQVAQARVRADAAAETLRDTLRRRDLDALARCADHWQNPGSVPVTTRGKHLADLEMFQAERRVRLQEQGAARNAWMRTLFSLFALAVVAVVGSRLLRNIF